MQEFGLSVDSVDEIKNNQSDQISLSLVLSESESGLGIWLHKGLFLCWVVPAAVLCL